MTSRNHHRRGFTLTEILVAMGLFAGSALAVAALFSAAHRMEGGALGEERATMIASGLLEGMDRGAAGGFRIATGSSEKSIHWEDVDPLTTSNLCVAYSSEGSPITTRDPSLAAEPCVEKEISDIAEIRFTHSKALPELVTVEIDVSSPAAAPLASRTVHRYLRQFPLAAH